MKPCLKRHSKSFIFYVILALRGRGFKSRLVLEFGSKQLLESIKNHFGHFQEYFRSRDLGWLLPNRNHIYKTDSDAQSQTILSFLHFEHGSKVWWLHKVRNDQMCCVCVIMVKHRRHLLVASFDWTLWKQIIKKYLHWGSSIWVKQQHHLLLIRKWIHANIKRERCVA